MATSAAPTERHYQKGARYKTFEERLILLKFKEGKNFNHRNTWSISRIDI